MSNHSQIYLSETAEISSRIDSEQLESLVAELLHLRTNGGRLFLIGVGGSAANCSHAVNDFRKLCGIETYAPMDNVAELTARTNDEGWESVFAAYLRTSKASDKDAVMVFSVGGGDAARNVSANIVTALDEAKSRNMKIFGIVGRDGGYTNKVGDNVVVVPSISSDRITPHTEAFQGILWHCIVCHPALMIRENKWEGLVPGPTA